MEPILDAATLTRMLDFGAEGLFYLITLVFLFFSLSIAYHWLTYSTNHSQSVMFLVVYVMGGMLFFIGMTASLTTF